jgi:four helix bundle protein
MRDFRDLKVWEKAHRLTLAVYKATNSFPIDEKYGLTNQIRRSSVSIPSNIAEGCGRNGEAELTRFLLIGMGSASELEYQMLLAHDLSFLSEQDHAKLNSRITEVKRMLASLIQKLRANS